MSPLNPQDSREAGQLRKLFRGPRRTPLLGNGPETIARVTEFLVNETEVDAKRVDISDNFKPKEKK